MKSCFIADVQVHHRADYQHQHCHSGDVSDLYPDPVPGQSSHQPEVQVQVEGSSTYRTDRGKLSFTAHISSSENEPINYHFKSKMLPFHVLGYLYYKVFFFNKTYS